MRLSLAALAVFTALFAYSLTATAQPVKQVEVVNFPNPQNVTGAVGVTNFPDPQNVVGFVAVTNFPAPATASRFQLVGFSSTPVTGDAGVLGMTLECQNDSPGSRMCTTVEVMETVAVPASLSGDAWVRPVVVPSGQAITTPTIIDASGINARARDMMCFGWASASIGRAGLSVTPTGAFALKFCNIAGPVACCAPVP